MTTIWWVLGLSSAILLAQGPDSAQRLLTVLSVAPRRPQVGSPRRRLPRRLSTTRAAVEVPYGLALELRAGQDLGAALEAVSLEQQTFPDLAARLQRAAAVARVGGEVRLSLLTAPAHRRDPLGPVLLATAACCGAAVSAGLPLADLLDAAAAAARAGVSLQGAAQAELAGARSSALLLAALPLAGAAMGQAIGARPVQTLLGTAWGVGCLLAAAGLTGAGLLWTRAITAGLREVLP